MNDRELVFPPKKILVPVDFSDASQTAWTYARSLGASFGSEVEGLYVERDWLVYGRYAPVISKLQSSLAELRRRLGAGEELAGVCGTVEETVLSWSCELDYDLIVMGTRGRAGLEMLMRGSVAEAVVGSASVPVLVVRPGHEARRSVLAPVNFEPYAMTALAAAGEVARALNARLTVVHVIETLYGGHDALKGPKRLLAEAIASLSDGVKAACKPTSALLFGDPVTQIAAFAKKEADLIVLSGHHKGELTEQVLGTTTQRLLRRCETPLFVLPPAQTPGASSRTSPRHGAAMAQAGADW